MEPRAMIFLLQHDHPRGNEHTALRDRYRRDDPDEVRDVATDAARSADRPRRRRAWFLRWRTA